MKRGDTGGERDLPHGGLVDQILPLPIILHVREIGGEHGIEGEDLLLDGATVGDLQKNPHPRHETPVVTFANSQVALHPLLNFLKDFSLKYFPF